VATPSGRKRASEDSPAFAIGPTLAIEAGITVVVGATAGIINGTTGFDTLPSIGVLEPIAGTTNSLAVSTRAHPVASTSTN
jgi:hypothetical protein